MAGPAPAQTPRATPTPSPVPAPGGAAVRGSRSQPEVMTGAQAIIRTLEQLGVDTVFGLPGGTILPTYDPLLDSEQINHVLVRHEQGAGHAATGYAAATGRVGVCMATSGPGATNLVTPIADAHMDSVPLLAITGQQSSKLLGTDAFQEADIIGMTMPVTKHSFLVTNAQDIPQVIRSAHHIASTGRPGPVLVDVTKDAQQAELEFLWDDELDLPGYRPVNRPHAKQIREAAVLMAEARRPVFYVGGGVIRSGAHKELLALAEATNIPVTTTLMARGAFPDSHPQHLGMPGMHGSVPAVAAIQKSDLLIAIGSRFDDRVTGELDDLRAQRPGHPCGHRPGRDRQEPRRGRADRGRRREVLDALLTELKANHSAALWPTERPPGGGLVERVEAEFPAGLREERRRTVRSAVRHPADLRAHRPRGRLRRGRRPAPDVGRAVRGVRASQGMAELRRSGHHGLLRARRDGCEGRRA